MLHPGNFPRTSEASAASFLASRRALWSCVGIKISNNVKSFAKDNLDHKKYVEHRDGDDDDACQIKNCRAVGVVQEGPQRKSNLIILNMLMISKCWDGQSDVGDAGTMVVVTLSLYSPGSPSA